MTTYQKLSDIRAALEETLGRPVSRQLADRYSKRKDFPAPKIKEPVRLWHAKDIEFWLSEL